MHINQKLKKISQTIKSDVKLYDIGVKFFNVLI